MKKFEANNMDFIFDAVFNDPLVESDTIFLLCKCYFKELLKWYLKHI